LNRLFLGDILLANRRLLLDFLRPGGPLLPSGGPILPGGGPILPGGGPILPGGGPLLLRGPLLASASVMSFMTGLLAGFSRRPFLSFLLPGFRFVGQSFRGNANLHVTGPEAEESPAALVEDLDFHFMEFNPEHLQCLLDGFLSRLRRCFN
jgi:hypothetical protein